MTKYDTALKIITILWKVKTNIDNCFTRSERIRKFYYENRHFYLKLVAVKMLEFLVFLAKSDISGKEWQQKFREE